MAIVMVIQDFRLP